MASRKAWGLKDAGVTATAVATLLSRVLKCEQPE